MSKEHERYLNYVMQRNAHNEATRLQDEINQLKAEKETLEAALLLEEAAYAGAKAENEQLKFVLARVHMELFHIPDSLEPEEMGKRIDSLLKLVTKSLTTPADDIPF